MRFWSLMLFAGCYAPIPSPGAPCSATGECPEGLSCNAERICAPEIVDGAVGSDARVDAIGVDADPGAVWGTPVALANVNGPGVESDPTLTADGLELFFMSTRSGGAGAADIYVARRIDLGSPFSAPSLVTEVVSTSNEYSPEISADGLVLYFASDRDGDFDVFMTTRPDRTSAFATPAAVPSLSTASDDINVGFSVNGTVAIVDRDAGAADRELFLYTNTGASWSLDEHLDILGSSGIDGAPSLDQTGLVVVFHSDRGNPTGNYDLYIATRGALGDPFSTPTKIDELDTNGSDGNPWISGDVRRILFARSTGNNRDIYEATR